MKKHFKSFFGKMMLQVITPADVQRYVSEKMKVGYAPRTVNKNLTVLRLMFKHTIIWGYLREDPARFVECPRVPRQEIDFLRPEEVWRFARGGPK